MATATNTTSGLNKRPLAKRVLRVALWGAGGLMLLLCLVIGGAIIWLKTDSGEKAVARITTNALANQGIFMTVDRISLLPPRIRAFNVRLADARGEWFAVKEADIHIQLSALLMRTFAVTLAHIDTPEIYRLPQLPPSTATQKAESDNAPATPGYFALPIGLRLDKLAIVNLHVYGPVLFPGAFGDFSPPRQKSMNDEARRDLEKTTRAIETTQPPLLRVNITGNAASKPHQPVNAVITSDTTVVDIRKLTALLQSGALPVNGLSITANIHTTAGKVIEAKINGVVTALAGEETLLTTYGAGASLVQTPVGQLATLQELFLDGSGVRLAANGEFNLDMNIGKTNATLKAENGGAWQTLAARAAGKRMEGEIAASINATLADKGYINATLALTGNELAWPTEQLHGIFGPALALRATVSGGGAAPYVVNLERLNAGVISATAQATFAPKAQTLDATLDAAVSNLAPLAPGITGALKARGTATGSLKALSFSLAATSDSFKNKTGTFTALKAVIDGKASLPGTAARSLTATAGIDVGASPAGPVAFKAVIEASQDLGGSITARVHDVNLRLAGTSLTADVTAVVPGGASSPPVSLKGSASAAITSWKSLAALAGIPLTGGKTTFDARFTHDATGQKATMTLQADRVELENTFALRGLFAELAASNFANPDIALAIRLGQGQAGPVTWQTGAANVHAQKGKGTFTATLRTDKTAQTALNTLGTSPASRPVNTERLTLQGAFSLTPLEINVNRFTTRLPDSPLGMYLAAPVKISLGDTTRIQGLNMNVVPGNGSVSLDALFNPQTATLNATVKELPFRLLQDLAGAPVPDGTLDATATLQKKGTFAQGEVIAKATMMPHPVADRKQGAARPVVLSLASTLNQKPDPNFPHLRSGGGISRFKGTAVLDIPGPSNGSSANTTAASGTTAGTTAGGTAAGGTAATSPTPRGTEKSGARIAFNLPLRFASSGVPAPDTTAPLAATLAWRGEVGDVWRLLPTSDRSLSGLAQVDANLKGSLAKPDYTVNAYMAGGKFEDGILGVLLTNIAVQAQSASNAETTLVLRAEDGQGGNIAIEGQLLQPGQTPAVGHAASVTKVQDRPATARKTAAKTNIAASTSSKSIASGNGPRILARGHINRLSPMHRDDLSLRLSGRLNVEGELAAPLITADVEIERGEISLISTLGGGVRTLEIAAPTTKPEAETPGPTLDIKVQVPNRFFIRGRGLDSEWEGELAVTGHAASPSLKGSLRPVRGAFDLLTKPFSFTGGDISFFGGDRINPGLNLDLTYAGPSITALVRAKGTASKPTISMESTPPLPQDQIIAAVLFGKNFSDLSRFESLQVANSVRELANIGQGGLDPLATMRAKLGVDMLRVGSSGAGANQNRSVSGAPTAKDMDNGEGASGDTSSEAATPTLEAGKYINDAIYIGVEQGMTADSTGVRVEVELRPNLNLTGKTSARSSEVGLGWKKDY